MKLTSLFGIWTLVILVLTTPFHNVQAIAKYKAIPLNYLVKANDVRKNTIVFEYHIFNTSDCKKFLGREQVITGGYQPIQIHLINNSDKHLEFNLQSFSFPLVDWAEIAEQVCFHTIKRTLGWGIPGLFIWPFLIPAAFEAVESPKANKRLWIDYESKALIGQVIEPHTSIIGLIFVAAEQFNPNFSFILIDQNNEEHLTISTRNREIKI